MQGNGEGVSPRIFAQITTRYSEITFRKLRMLNRSITLIDVRVPPANCLEKLHGHRKGQYSIRINKRWRVCFEWHKGDAFNVEIVDYH